MATATPKLEWCTISFDNESMWWVQTVNKDIHWDFDELGIIDPRQLSHILELLDSMREYGIQEDIVEKAFFKFRLEKEMTKQKFRLERTRDSLYDPDQVLFVLPDDMDEESGPFEDFMKHALRVRVRMLNDLIESDQPLTIEEVDAQIREPEPRFGVHHDFTRDPIQRDGHVVHEAPHRGGRGVVAEVLGLMQQGQP